METSTTLDPQALPEKLAAAIALHQQDQLTPAAALYREILAAAPGHLDALYLLSLLELGAGRAQSAADLIDAAIAVAPQHPQAHFTRGNVMQKLQRPQDAVDSYDRAIALNSHYAEAYYNRGAAQQELGRHADALASYDAALRIKPDDAEALTNRGAVLQDLKRPDEAIASYERALALRPAYAKALYNRGSAQQKARRPQAALADFDAALAADPDYVEALVNRGALLEELGRGDEALASYARALQVKPDYAKAHWNESLSLLLAGDFARGWEKHEWRWQALNLQHLQRPFAQPLWLGKQSLAGRTILLHAEQGLGDTLQFCRYCTMVAALGATVILEVQAPLLSLLSGLPGVAVLLTKGAPLPAFDFHCPLMSLPLAFNTDLAGLPPAPPYLQAPAAIAAAWQDKLGAKTGLRIGIAWSGSPTHGNDHNRSVALASMLALAEDAPQARFFSIQKELRGDDRMLMDAHPEVRHFGPDLHDFAETAGLIAALDLVITVDTSVAHLAGALGKPVWILLPFSPDWRWMRGRDDNPWYPSARLWRQSEAGDWDAVFARIGRAAGNLANNDNEATM